MSKASTNEDFLEEDAEIPGQKFCLLSFLSPEKVLADKNIFMFHKFLQTYEFASRTKSIEAYLMKTANEINDKLEKEAENFDAQDLSGAADLCRKSRLRMDTLMDSFQTFVKENERELKESKLKEAYDEFLFKGKAKLEDEFFVKNDFHTTVRGLKIRGVYGSQPEAVARSKKLQRTDPLHNIFVGEVGKWLPWDPSPNDVAEQEYAEDQLNTLMKKYKENEEQREVFEREQRKRAAASGSKNMITNSGITITRDTDSLGADVSNVAGSVAESNVSNIFETSGPADLAIARKMEGGGSA